MRAGLCLSSTISVAVVLLAALVSSAVASPALALETPATAAADFISGQESREQEQQRKEVEQFLNNIETQWNAHNLEAVMSYYADDYVNNDGLDKKAVSALTQDFWKTYPDAKSTSRTKQIRIEGPYVTVESRDTASGTTAKEMPGIGTRGELQSVSEGQLYLKRIGQTWKIVGDRIDYEKVKVAFGLAKQLQASFSAPEQVKAGRQYSARLEVTLPQGLTAVGSITSQPLQYPQPQPTDAWRPLESTPAVLERVMSANSKNKNELLMATVGVTNSARNSLMGIAFLTRRLNVVPPSEESPAQTATASSETAASPAAQKK
jgi:ketosteroid isomerase-like protein